MQLEMENRSGIKLKYVGGILAFLFLLVSSLPVKADNLLYGISREGNFYSIDVATGTNISAGTFIRSLPVLGPYGYFGLGFSENWFYSTTPVALGGYYKWYLVRFGLESGDESIIGEVQLGSPGLYLSSITSSPSGSLYVLLDVAVLNGGQWVLNPAVVTLDSETAEISTPAPVGAEYFKSPGQSGSYITASIGVSFGIDSSNNAYFYESNKFSYVRIGLDDNSFGPLPYCIFPGSTTTYYTSCWFNTLTPSASFAWDETTGRFWSQLGYRLNELQFDDPPSNANQLYAPQAYTRIIRGPVYDSFYGQSTLVNFSGFIIAEYVVEPTPTPTPEGEEPTPTPAPTSTPEEEPTPVPPTPNPTLPDSPDEDGRIGDSWIYHKSDLFADKF